MQFPFTSIFDLVFKAPNGTFDFFNGGGRDINNSAFSHLTFTILLTLDYSVHCVIAYSLHFIQFDLEKRNNALICRA